MSNYGRSEVYMPSERGGDGPEETVETSIYHREYYLSDGLIFLVSHPHDPRKEI
jgi:hypothetical protein